MAQCVDVECSTLRRGRVKSVGFLWQQTMDLTFHQLHQIIIKYVLVPEPRNDTIDILEAKLAVVTGALPCINQVFTLVGFSVLLSRASPFNTARTEGLLCWAGRMMRPALPKQAMNALRKSRPGS